MRVPLRVGFIPLLLLLLPPRGSAQEMESLGKLVSFDKIENGILLKCAGARAAVTFNAPDIARVRACRGEFGADFSYAVILPKSTVPFILRDGGEELLLQTAELVLRIRKDPVRMRFETPAGKILNEDYAPFGIFWQGTEVSCAKKLHADERFLGLGEKTGRLDRRGSVYTNWNADHYAYGPNDDPLYTSIPFFIGLHDSLAYGIFFDNTRRSRFDFGASTDNRYFGFSAIDGEMNYYFFAGPGVRETIEQYTRLTGRMPMPPLWSLGYQQCRWSYYPDSEVLELARTFRRKQIPCDAIYLDIHYMEGYKVFTWDPARFPRPKELIDSLSAMGFHVVTIVDPGIKIEKGYFAYEEGVKSGCFVKYPGGELYTGEVWPGRCHFPDFTDPKARSWWGRSLRRLTEPGVEGFWNDMNEPAVWGQNIPEIVRFDYEGLGATMRETHNVYGLEMARATCEGAKTLMDGKRPFILTRAAYAGIQRYSAVWTGDNAASDEHMLLGARMITGMGLSGIPFAGMDIGGFSSDAAPELFERWMALGTFTPLFRNHKQYGRRRQEPWSFGEETEARVRGSIRLRYALLPYIYSTFYEATQNGMPVARSLAIEFPFDDKVYWNDYQNEFLFGGSILVAPCASASGNVKVYLPEGRWYSHRTGEQYEGGREYLIPAPAGTVPVFMNEGAIIPMQAPVEHTGRLLSDTLDISVYDGRQKREFVYYEDDGLTRENEKGVYWKRVIRYDPEGGVTFEPVEGSYASRYRFARIHFQEWTQPIPEGKGGFIVVPWDREKATHFIRRRFGR